jgi:hypothetical protein
MLLGTTFEKPSALASRICLASSGGEAGVIASQRGRMREKEVRDEHGLGASKVRVRRHQGRGRLLRLIGARADERRQVLLQEWDPPAQVQPQVERDLLVARAARVQPASGVADALDKAPLDEAVDILIGPGH